MVSAQTFTFKRLLNTNEHGFGEGRSVETNLLCFYIPRKNPWNPKNKLVSYTLISVRRVLHCKLLCSYWKITFVRYTGCDDLLAYLTDGIRQVKCNGFFRRIPFQLGTLNNSNTSSNIVCFAN